MRIRKVAVLIDGGFFIKRLPKLVRPDQCDSPMAVANAAVALCKRLVRNLIGDYSVEPSKSRWLDHVYRLFYYDAAPHKALELHPLSRQQIDFGKLRSSTFHEELFTHLRRKRKFALRLGKLTSPNGWRLRDKKLIKRLLQTRDSIPIWDKVLNQSKTNSQPEALSASEAEHLQALRDLWASITDDDLRLDLRQKGVDMRIGVDITTLTLKHQVDTIILVTGDSDFVPAAKVARREGVEFLLCPMWQQVNDDLMEHIDGIAAGFTNAQGQEKTAGRDSSPPQASGQTCGDSLLFKDGAAP